METERKYIVRRILPDIESYPYHMIEQAYLCTDPVIRIRRQDDSYILTCKGGGMMSREELNLPMPQSSYESLLPRTEGNIISKRRYLIPLDKSAGNGISLTAELDIFSGIWEGLIIVEVEFPDEETARQFTPPDWFDEEVTFDGRFHNSYLSTCTDDSERLRVLALMQKA